MLSTGAQRRRPSLRSPVRVVEQFTIEKYSQFQHISSHVSAR
jgi:anthranilate/para-aminobenzoate synthase component I